MGPVYPKPDYSKPLWVKLPACEVLTHESVDPSTRVRVYETKVPRLFTVIVDARRITLIEEHRDSRFSIVSYLETDETLRRFTVRMPAEEVWKSLP